MNVLRIAVVLALLSAGATVLFDNAHAQGIDYGEIDKFQSLGTGTLQVGAPPKTIVDDGELVRSECSFTEGVAAFAHRRGARSQYRTCDRTRTAEAKMIAPSRGL